MSQVLMIEQFVNLNPDKIISYVRENYTVRKPINHVVVGASHPRKTIPKPMKLLYVHSPLSQQVFATVISHKKQKSLSTEYWSRATENPDRVIFVLNY